MAKRRRRGGVNRYLDLRGKTWWFKRNIPEAYRGHYGGRTAIVCSTGTGDLVRARAFRDEREAQVDADFAALASGKDLPTSPHSPADLGRKMREEIAAAAEADGRMWDSGDDSDGISPFAAAPPRSVDLGSIADDMADGFRGVERSAFLNALHGHQPVDAFLDDYASFRADLRPKTVAERRGLVGQLAAWATPRGLTVLSLGRREAGSYMAEKLDGRDRATVKKHLTALRDYWSFLFARGHIPSPRADNPWNGQLAPQRAGGGRRNGPEPEEERPFTTAEVVALLYGEAARTYNADHVPDILDVLRVALLSGLRANEVIGLAVGDVAEGAIFVREGKTRAARRRVPMHPDLVALFAQRTRGRRDGDPVFPDLAALDDPRDAFGKRFKRYREAAGVSDRRAGQRRSLVNFHSARRWFSQQARHAGHPLETLGEVIGHAPPKASKVTLGYTGRASWAQMQALVESVRLPPPPP